MEKYSKEINDFNIEKLEKDVLINWKWMKSLLTLWTLWTLFCKENGWCSWNDDSFTYLWGHYVQRRRGEDNISKQKSKEFLLRIQQHQRYPI